MSSNMEYSTDSIPIRDEIFCRMWDRYKMIIFNENSAEDSHQNLKKR